MDNKEIYDAFNLAFYKIETSLSKEKQVGLQELKDEISGFLDDALSGNVPSTIIQNRFGKIIIKLRKFDSVDNHSYLSDAFHMMRLIKKKQNADITNREEFAHPNGLLDTLKGKTSLHSKLMSSMSESKEDPENLEDKWEEKLEKLEKDPEPLFKEVDEIDDLEDIHHLYDLEDFHFHDSFETHLEESKLEEHLSREERIRRKIRFNKSKPKRERAREIALKKLSPNSKIIRKARKLAINLIKEKLAHKKLDNLSLQEKERLEDLILKRKELVNRLSAKLANKIRQIERKRVLGGSKNLKEDILNEVAIATDINRDTKFGYDEIYEGGMSHVRKHGVESSDTMTERPVIKKIDTVNGIHHSLVYSPIGSKYEVHVVAHDDDGKVHGFVKFKRDPKFHSETLVSSLASKRPDAHPDFKTSDIYKTMTKKLGATIISGKDQSMGGIKMWQKLARDPELEVYAWDLEDDKPINTDRYLRSLDDSHTKIADYSSDLDDVEKKHLNKLYSSVRLVMHKKIGKNDITEALYDPKMSEHEKYDHDIFFGHNGIHDAHGYLGITHQMKDLGKAAPFTHVRQYEEKRATSNKGYIMSHDSNGVVHHVIQYTRPNPEENRISIDLVTKNPKAHHEIGAHHLYHHLLKNGYEIESGLTLSSGGKKLWERLSQIPDVKISGWDYLKKEPYKIEKVDDVLDKNPSSDKAIYHTLRARI